MSNTSLEEIAEKFTTCQSTKTRSGKLPKELWRVAVEACEHHPASRVAKVAGLDYYQLRAKVGESKTTELTCSEVVSVPTAESNFPVLQITHPNGFSLAVYKESVLVEMLLKQFFQSC